MENHNIDSVKLPKSSNNFLGSLNNKIKNLWTKISSKPIYLFAIIFGISGCILLINTFAASNSFSGKLSHSTPIGKHTVLVESSGTLTATVKDTGGRRADNIRYTLRLLKSTGEAVVSFEATNVGEPVTLTSTVTPGSYTIEVSSKDPLSKRGTTYSLGVTYPDPAPPVPTDTQSPVVTVNQPTANVTVSSGVTISGTASDNSAVSVVNYRFAGGNWQTATGTTNWSGLLDSTTQVNGTVTIEVQAKDSAGNIGTKSLTVTVYNQVATPNPAGTLLWQANATTSIDKEWSSWSDDVITTGEPSPDGALYAGWTHPNMQLISSLGNVLPNKPSYRVYMPIGDSRQEFKQAHPIRTGFENRVFSEGDETWVSWATKLTKFTYSPSWQMFDQFRHVNETGLTTSGSPHGLGASKSSQNYEWSSDPNLYSGADWRYDLGIPLTVDKTVKWTFHAKWSSNASIGFMEVFADDGSGWRQVMPKRTQATLLFNSATGKSGKAAMRFGVYRDPAIANTATEIYMAGLSVATTRELAEYKAFSQ